MACGARLSTRSARVRSPNTGTRYVGRRLAVSRGRTVGSVVVHVLEAEGRRREVLAAFRAMACVDTSDEQRAVHIEIHGGLRGAVSVPTAPQVPRIQRCLHRAPPSLGDSTQEACQWSYAEDIPVRVGRQPIR